MIETLEKQEEKGLFLVKTREQNSLEKSVSFDGIGVFSGRKVKMTFHPKEAGFGIKFKRIDLPNHPEVEANTQNLKGTPRCTILEKDGVQVQCVEHVLSALSAFNIDNLLIEIDSIEPPIMDGSSLAFSQKIIECGVASQKKLVEELYLQKPVYLADERAQIIALPSNQLEYSYTLSYPNHPILSAQFHKHCQNTEKYLNEIAPCRTFVLYEEVKVLIDKGLIKGANLDHGVVIDGEKILNEGGSRFQNEMARHKILDMIGDLSLTNKRIIAHYVAVCSGHHLNTSLAKHLDELCKGSV